MEEKDPRDFFPDSPGHLILVAGDIKSGRSTFLKSQTDHLIQYRPLFGTDRKNLVATLSSFEKNSTIGIETSLPVICEHPPSLLKDLKLLAKLKKHNYLLEWRCKDSEIGPLLGPTIAGSVYLAFYTHGIVRSDSASDKAIMSRLAAVAIGKGTKKPVLDINYSVLVHKSVVANKPSVWKYNVTEHLKE